VVGEHDHAGIEPAAYIDVFTDGVTAICLSVFTGIYLAVLTSVCMGVLI
jgi:hypothetical protein